MLNLHNVSFSYHDRPLLQNICINCNPGEIHVLLGKNGSGKSTLLQCIAGILHPQMGNICIEHQNITMMSPKLIAQRVALVQQTMQYSFSYSVEDMVLMGRTAHLNFLGQVKQHDYDIVQESLELVGMLAFQNRSYMELSSGEKQMVLLARAICQNPKVLLLDEPNSHLDIPNQWKLLHTITKLSKEKQWVVLAVLHNPEIAYWFADTVHLLLNGEIVYTGCPQDILIDKNLSEVYEIPIKTYHIPNNHISIINF